MAVTSAWLTADRKSVTMRVHQTIITIHPNDARELRRQIDEALQDLARQRITRAQDTVDEIRSKHALRSDFV